MSPVGKHHIGSIKKTRECYRQSRPIEPRAPRFYIKMLYIIRYKNLRTMNKSYKFFFSQNTIIMLN